MIFDTNLFWIMKSRPLSLEKETLCKLLLKYSFERKIRIKVKLVNMKTQEVVKNENKILLHLGLQTWEIPSNPILRNKTGRDC